MACISEQEERQIWSGKMKKPYGEADPEQNATMQSLGPVKDLRSAMSRCESPCRFENLPCRLIAAAGGFQVAMEGDLFDRAQTTRAELQVALHRLTAA